MQVKRFDLPEMWEGVQNRLKGILPTRKPSMSKAPATGTFGQRTSKAVRTFLVKMSRSRKLFWFGYIVVTMVTVYFAGVRGLFYSRIGEAAIRPDIDAFTNEFLQYGQFIVAVLGYLFALPMDTIPGKGKWKEFLGDALVASSFFVLFKAATVLVYCYDIFSRGAGVGLSADAQRLISLNGPEVLKYGLLFIGILVALRWLIARNKNTP